MRIIPLLILIIFTSITSCNKKNQTTPASEKEQVAVKTEVAYYTVDDFKKVPKIDTHIHINDTSKVLINLAKANSFKLLNIAIDLDEENYPTIAEEVRTRAILHKEYPQITEFSTAFAMKGWDDVNWVKHTKKQLQADFEQGAIAIKTWKNIGMGFKDKNGKSIYLDDPKLDSIFKFIAEKGIVLVSHAGEPHNCWLPLDSMTVNNDKAYFKKNPKFHMYLHPEMPSYDEQIAHRDNMLEKNPDLVFIGAHMGSLEWSVDKAAAFLDRYPNTSFDLAERVSHTQYQSQKDYDKVRNFIIKYQDRIVYATDISENAKSNPEKLTNYITTLWENDWKYFVTDQMITVPQLDTPVKGLALPKDVINKIYYKNAQRIFPTAWKN